MPQADLKEHLKQAVHLAQRRLVNDLKAIPAERQNASPGGAGRTPLHIVAECAMVNGRVAEYLRTGKFARPSPEEREEKLAGYGTEAEALAFLTEQTEDLLRAIEELDASTLGEQTNEPFGRCTGVKAEGGIYSADDWRNVQWRFAKKFQKVTATVAMRVAPTKTGLGVSRGFQMPVAR